MPAPTFTALVVDDDPVARRVVAFALHQEGFQCDQARDGAEASTWSAAKKYDLVVTDLRMPKKHGHAFCLELLGHHKTPLLFVHSSVDDPRIVKDLIFRGVDDIISKPSNYPVFAAKARALVERRNKANRVVPATASVFQSEIAESASASIATPGAAVPEAAVPEAAVPEAATPEAATPEAAVPGTPADEKKVATDPALDGDSLQDMKPLFTRSEVQEALENCGELKGMSPTVAQVLKLTRQKDCSIEAVAKIIKQDHAISLKVLKLSNSSVYTRGEPVDTVQKAVTRIGLSQINNLVMNLSVVDKFSGVEEGERLNSPQFWEHSIATGLIAAEITRKTGGDEEAIESAFTMGLLHDVGRMVYAEMFGDKYMRVMDVAYRLQLPLEQVESRLMLINHADAMDRVLHAWHFPKDLINPIAFHHLSVGNIRRMAPRSISEVSTLALANRLAHALLLGSSGNLALYPIEEYISILKLDGPFVRKIEEEIPEQTADIKFAMLSRANGQSWPEMRTILRQRLGLPFRPIIVSHDTELEAVRIFCNRLADPVGGEDAAPNIVVAHLNHKRECVPVTTKLREAEQQAGVASLPVIILSPKGDLRLEERVMAGRHVQQLPLPLAVDRLVNSIKSGLVSRE